MNEKRQRGFWSTLGRLFGLVPIRWCCEHCGRRHFWWWSQWGALRGPILMECARCNQKTRYFLEKDGLVNERSKQRSAPSSS